MNAAALLPLLPELAGAGAVRVLTPLRTAWRRNWFYRRLFLQGPLTDHFAHHPYDALPRRLEDADGLLRGRFRFHGETVEAKEGVSIFDLPPPSPQWQAALHGFAWLPALSTAGGEAARIDDADGKRVARRLVGAIERQVERRAADTGRRERDAGGDGALDGDRRGHRRRRKRCEGGEERDEGPLAHVLLEYRRAEGRSTEGMSRKTAGARLPQGALPLPS
jgi:hypothetical protein